MRDSDFLSKVVAVEQWIDDLRRSAAASGQALPVSPASLNDLQSRLQELRRSGEVLYQRNEELATLYEASLEIIKPHDLATLLNIVVERAARLLDAPAGGLYLCDPESEEVHCVVSYNTPHDYTGTVLKFGEGAAGTIALTGEPLIFNNYHAWSKQAAVYQKEPLSAMLSVPLIWQGQVIGVIFLLDDAKMRRFTKADLDLLTWFANQAAIAVQNARLWDTLREQREVAETLRQVAGALSTSLDLGQVLRLILGQLLRVVEYDSASVMLVVDDALEIVAYQSFRARGRRFTPLRVQALGHVQEVLEHRRPVIIPDTSADARWQHFPGTEYIRCWLGVPLIVKDRVIGLLNLAKEQPRFYKEREAELALAFAQQAAIAIENARLYAEVSQRAVELSTLLEASRAASSTLELESVLTLIAQQMVTAIGVTGCTLFRFDPEADRITTWVEWREGSRCTECKDAVYSLKELPATRLVLEERQPRVILATNPDADPAEVALLREQDAVSLLMLPLAAGDRVIGLAKLVNGAERTFTDAEIGLCRALASQAAVAIQNALLFEEVRAGRQRLETLSRQLVQLQEVERRHIARELHDEISQVLTGLKLALETIRRLPADMARERLGKAQELVNELMARVRELSLNLRPTMLDDSGLLPALLWHFGHYTAQTGVVVSFEHSGLERRFPAEVETAAYRIVQEALTNVARYAGVNEVAVRVTADEEKLCVEVEDEGVGFDPMSALGAGSTFGLVGMHERAILLGGQLTLDSAPGRGTRLKAELPVGDAINKGDSDAGNNHRAGRRSPDRSRGAAGVVRN